MKKQESNRANFGSRMGAILAAAGSAVGLGNIWRFPCECGANGGAAFILLYVVCIAVIAVPVLITEMALGRHAKANAYDTLSRLGGGIIWKVAGTLCVMAGFMVLSYYSVVAGWTLNYVWEALISDMMGKDTAGYAADFAAFSSDPVKPALFLVVFIVITAGIVILGVQKGIERGSKIMMPLLFILLLVLCVCSLSLPGSMKGLEFLFKPDFSKLTTDTLLSAMGQAFFTLSVGIGCLLTYASYFSEKVNIVKDAFSIASIDTLVAILAGIIIFPAAMAVGVNPDAGPSLVFITLPNVFQRAFGSIPLLCYVVTLMFYILLTMAALTSSISMLEISTAFVTEKTGIRRWQAVSVVALFTIIVGFCCSMSFGEWADFKVFGMGMFDFADFFVAKFAMPIGGIMMSILIGWKTTLLPRTLQFMARYVVPIAIFIIFINEL